MSPLDQAIALHRAGNLAAAESLYRQILSVDPGHAHATQLLGLIACQTGQLQTAEQLILRAVELAPLEAEFHINLGEVQRRLGKLHAAAQASRRAIELGPQNPAAYYNLGVILAASGDGAGAIAAYQHAIELQPRFPEALNNLGLQLRLAGRDQEAVDTLRRALALRPQHAEAENNLGLALWNLKEYSAAIAAFTRAITIRPEFAGAHANLGLALRRTGRRAEGLANAQRAAELSPHDPGIHRDLALAHCDLLQLDHAIAVARRAVELSPQDAEMHQALGVVLHMAAKRNPSCRDEAIACFHRALAIDPRPEWAFELANLQQQTPLTCPDQYVTKLFDGYAPNFESHLVEQLNYQVPESLLAALQSQWRAQQRQPRDLSILDLGCGTGRCGALFRPLARTITGIDLSPGMLAEARRRNDAAGRPCYDRLIQGHILPALAEFQDACDAILAADVFIYVGDLDAVMAAIARALKPGGMAAFSLERHDDPQRDFILRERFAHSLGYIRRLAETHCLKQLCAEACHLRNDVPPGWLVVLQK